MKQVKPVMLIHMVMLIHIGDAYSHRADEEVNQELRDASQLQSAGQGALERKCSFWAADWVPPAGFLRPAIQTTCDHRSPPLQGLLSPFQRRGN